MTTLQEQFVKSLGGPIKIGSDWVIQLDKIPIRNGVVEINFERATDSDGIALKPVDGHVELSDGQQVRMLHVWHSVALPDVVRHRVFSKAAELRIWNVYPIRHRNGDVTEEAWTGNAGMIVKTSGTDHRSYRCSAGPGGFNPVFEFSIRWEDLPEGGAKGSGR